MRWAGGVLGVILCGLGILAYMRWHSFSMLVSERVSLTLLVDNYCSSTAQEYIQAFYDDVITSNSCMPSLTHILDAVLIKFPYLYNGRLRYAGANSMILECCVSAPRACVNRYILTESGNLVDRSLYQEFCLNGLPVVTVVQEDALDKQEIGSYIHTALARMTADMLNTFSVVWHNPYRLELTSKEHPMWGVWCSYDNLPTPTCLAQCAQLFADTARQQPKRVARERIITDVRFTQQIIVFFEKKGACYG